MSKRNRLLDAQNYLRGLKEKENGDRKQLASPSVITGKDKVIRPPLVYIVGRQDNFVTSMFRKRGYLPIKEPLLCDILVFTGGSDVSPELYGQTLHRRTHPFPERDVLEKAMFEKSLKIKEMLRVGICRGGQFLNVMSGGEMYQDVDNHQGTHKAFDIATKRLLSVTSTHHQMMKPSNKAEIIMVADKSHRRETDTHVWIRPSEDENNKIKPWSDTEVCFYPETNSLCFQPHPELSENLTDTCSYFFELIQHYKPEISSQAGN